MRCWIPLLLTVCLTVSDSPNSSAAPQRGGSRNGRGGTPSGKRLNPEDLEIKDGRATVPDRETFQTLSYKGPDVMIDRHLADQEFVKFQLENAGTDKAQLFWLNTNTWRAHPHFMNYAGLTRGAPGQMRGVLIFKPMAKSPSGNPGLYTFEFEPFDAYTFDKIKIAYDIQVKTMPFLKGNLAYFPMYDKAVAVYEREKELYKKAGIPVVMEEDLFANIGYLPLNSGESFGRLRIMEQDELPSPRDIVVYKSLPNEMPRVAGIITAVRQTPLSHVNLRAIQDKVPNSFITGAAENKTIAGLVGKNVFYKASVEGFEIREATTDELEKHFANIRPKTAQTPKRNLSVTYIKRLDDVGFADSDSIGVKAANVATMRTFKFPDGTVPDGAAIPFYFYDEFMKHNGFYESATKLMNNPEFKASRDVQVAELKAFRKRIEKAEWPEAMKSALAELHQSFPAGQSLRCRSSTNNEDLPGFSGAGLYGSYTHKKKEGHLSKTIAQVYASLWNFRAYEERDFYRIDHMQAAMGVLVHPNSKDEKANGVAVTDDILYQTQGNYYLNAQVGEDLVTNPDEESIPEELLLDWWKSSKTTVMRESNRLPEGQRILSEQHLTQMNKYLARIHARFQKLYGVAEDDKFAMEIEFKVSKDGTLLIKQARPWVY